MESIFKLGLRVAGTGCVILIATWLNMDPIQFLVGYFGYFAVMDCFEDL